MNKKNEQTNLDAPQFKTNVIGVMHTIRVFLPLIKAGDTKKVFVISSSMGSPKFVLDMKSAATIAYGTSKAALNMVVVKFALNYEDVLFLAIEPGLVRTIQGRECLFLVILSREKMVDICMCDPM